MMGSDCYEECIVSISFWDTFKIHFLSFLVGSWVVFKRCLCMLWSSKDSTLEIRDSPPACLIDSSFGQHSYIKLKGVKLHYVESGSRQKPLLLLLHGFPDCWLGWRHQIPVLSKHFRVVALDLRGFGDSDKPAWRSSYRTDVILLELRMFVEALGVSKCILLGHDLGALLGWYLVHRYPDLIEKYISISCPHPNIYWKELPKASTFNSSWVNFIQLPYLPETEALKGDLSIINQCYQHLQKKEDSLYVDAYKYSFSRKEDWTGPINYYRNLPFYRVSDESGIVQAPCLLITGNKDHFVNLESMVKSTDYTEKFTVKIVDGAGHFPHQEAADNVNKLLLSFLVIPDPPPKIEKSPTKSGGLMNRMFGAVTSTVKMGNQVLDVVHRKTSDVVNGTGAANLDIGHSQS